MPNPRIKNEEQYEALREKGYSKKSLLVSQTRLMAEKKAVKPKRTKSGQKMNFMRKLKM